MPAEASDKQDEETGTDEQVVYESNHEGRKKIISFDKVRVFEFEQGNYTKLGEGELKLLQDEDDSTKYSLLIGILSRTFVDSYISARTAPELLDLSKPGAKSRKIRLTLLAKDKNFKIFLLQLAVASAEALHTELKKVVDSLPK